MNSTPVPKPNAPTQLEWLLSHPEFVLASTAVAIVIALVVAVVFVDPPLSYRL